MLWWILGIVAALLALLCLTRVGIRSTFDGPNITVDVTIGPFRKRIFPVAEKAEKENPAKKKKASKKEKKPPNPQEMLSKISLEMIKSAIHDLAPVVKKALRRTRRGIRVSPLRIFMTVGGAEEPADAAQLYGYLNGRSGR